MGLLRRRGCLLWGSGATIEIGGITRDAILEWMERREEEGVGGGGTYSGPAAT